jgi:hypothetical protein
VGEEVNEEYVGVIRPFNTPFEAGMRALFVLQVVSSERVDLQANSSLQQID